MDTPSAWGLVGYVVSIAIYWSAKFFYVSHSVSVVGLRPSSSISTACVLLLKGRLSHFLPRWLKMGWQNVISQGKIPWNVSPRLGVEPRPQGGQTVSCIHSIIDLSWPGPRRGQTVRCIHSTIELEGQYTSVHGFFLWVAMIISNLWYSA